MSIRCSQKNDDPLSPAYVPSIFSFTSSPKKRKAEQSLRRYESAKRRKENKDEAEAVSALLDLACQADDEEDTPLNPPNTACVNTQTDLTAVGLAVLEDDYHQRAKELSELYGVKGYPDKEDLKGDDKLLRFYTSLSSFTVLIALFKLVSSSIPESLICKL